MAVQLQMRRGTTAEWEAADPTLANGEWGLDTTTKEYYIGDGSTLWSNLTASSLPATAISTTVIDAVGDIFIGTADNVAGRLAVGTNDHVLTADSTVSNVGLKWAASTHPTPTTITVAADTSDTTCFPGLFTAATGDLPPKTDATLTYDASNGTLGATTFSGALSGNAATATNSTTVTVADTTDTTCFVGVFEAVSGELAPKTDAALIYNAGTGSLEATVFTGPLAGLASSASTAAACTGNSATATSATTAGTVTTAAQGAITSVGTLSTLAVDGTSQLYECLTEAISGNKTPALGDAGKVFYCSQSGGTQTITIDGSISWPVGTQMVFVASNTSTVTFAESNSTSLDSKDDNKSIDGRYASAALINYGSNTWFLIGALA